ncbi:MAG: hypothetical protein AB9903_35215 [Vulcanimicrobiota bacterium]
MELKEYFTEEPFDIPGVDIPCFIGDFMDIRDNDPSSFDWDEGTVKGFHYCTCRKVHFLKEGEPLCDLDAVDDFTEKISTRSIDRYDAAQEAEKDNISPGSSCSDDAFTPCAPAIPSEESAGTDSFSPEKGVCPHQTG